MYFFDQPLNKTADGIAVLVNTTDCVGFGSVRTTPESVNDVAVVSLNLFQPPDDCFIVKSVTVNTCDFVPTKLDTTCGDIEF